jgi:hypothetical protein
MAATVGFSASAYVVDEDDEDGLITITVVRTGTVGRDFAVKYATYDGTAQASDYARSTGTLSFTAGVASRTFTVRVYDDVNQEDDETVILMLSDVHDVERGVTEATLTIRDDESRE